MCRANVKHGALLCLSGLVLFNGCSTAPDTKPLRVQAAPTQQAAGSDVVLTWNDIALQAEAADHSGTFGTPRQGGPTRSSRAMAIVHIAMYDAVIAIDRSFQPYIPVSLSPAVIGKAAVGAAVAQACHDTLVALYPNQRAVFDQKLDLALEGIPAQKGRNEGVTVGSQAAANILALRASDGSADGDTAIYPATASPPLPGQHRPDPAHPDQGLLTPGWGHVRSFSAIDVTAAGVRAPAPPTMTSPAYAAACADVKRLGGDGIATPTDRSQDETETGLFWAYDGTPKLGTPPRLYNQVVRAIAKQQQNTLVDNARLFALTNIAMADCGIACWDSKYFHNIWRPVIGIRHADVDANPQTIQDATWTPLGAPASNESGTNFTPPFPAYPSGHATFGGAVFRTLRNFYGTDDIAYRLTSDELRGRTTDSTGKHRYTVVRHFRTFTEGRLENGRSRIYLGIHWQFDADSGIAQGMTIADHVFSNLLQPAP